MLCVLYEEVKELHTPVKYGNMKYLVRKQLFDM